MIQHDSFGWYDGGIKPLREIAVSPLNRAYLIGYGVFETMHGRGGKVFAVTRHWRRLCQSCEVLGIREPSLEEFIAAVEETVKANGLAEEGKQARVRCTVSPDVDDVEEGRMLVTAVEAERFADAEKLASVSWPRNERSPLSRVKCVSYAENALARQMVAGRAGEALWGNLAGEVCEGSTSNVFFVEKGAETLLTPPLEAGCLPGVIRGLVMELAEKHGVPIQQRTLPMSVFKDGVQEVFLTSSTRYVQAVSHVDEQALEHCPGSMTRRMAALLEELVSSDPDP